MSRSDEERPGAFLDCESLDERTFAERASRCAHKFVPKYLKELRENE